MKTFDIAMVAVESLMDNDKEFEAYWAGISVDKRIDLMQEMAKKFEEEGVGY